MAAKMICRLLKFSLFCRIVVIFLQVVFNICVPDHEADAFRLPHIPEDGFANTIVSFLLSGFSRWDAQYFLHIALYGYTHENTLAFFPLFPLSLRKASNGISYVIPSVLSDLNLSILSGVVLNTILFLAAVVFLFKLTRTVFHSEIIAYTTALLFSINPASIFFSALYSESLFSFFTFGGLWALESGNLTIALILLSLSTGVRSNGVLSAGFIIYCLLKQCVNSRAISSHLSSKRTLFLLWNLLKIIVHLILFSIPFVAYQTYCYFFYCTDILSEPEVPDVVWNFLTKNDLKIPSEPSKWCFWNIPLSYFYVQNRYWNVGFLQYFTPKQIPNFLLAFPILFIVIFSTIKYLNKNWSELWHLCLLIRQYEDPTDVYNFMSCFPYFIHILVLTLFSTFCIHIQVATRMLCSSSPILYWIAAVTLLPSDERARFKFLKEHLNQRGLTGDLQFMKNLFLKSSIWGRLIYCYFLSYLLVGTFLHVNFLPWT